MRRPDPDANREPAPDDTEDAAPEVPPELQRVGLRFLLTGVQQSMFDMAASVLKTRKRSLRRREDVLEEMCRMVLGSVGSSTSSRVRTTLVVYRDPATGSDWVETDRGPLRVAREDLEHMAAEGEVVHVARPETEADLPSEILDRSRTPRVPRQDVQRLLDPTPLAPLQTPPAPGEAPAVLEQPSDSQGASTSLDELRPGKIAFPCGGSDSQGATTSLDEGLPPLPVASEPPSQARFPADLAEQEPPHDPSPFEPPPVAETRASRMGQGARPVPTASDPPLEGRHGTAGGAASPDPGASYPRRPWSRGRRAPIPAAVFRKLWLRCGGRCENPGCGRGGPLHVHHDDAWSDEHHHDPDRMRLLCERCHALLHEDDFATRPDWAAARAWRMARAGPVSPARDEGPPGPRAGQGDCLPRPSSRA